LERWEEGIRKFDIDLRIRMMRISAHEVTGINLDSISFIRRVLGFIDRSRFPAWRDNTKEWRNRNRERVNELGRIQSKNWRLKNLKKARDRDRRYYLKRKLRLEMFLEKRGEGVGEANASNPP